MTIKPAGKALIALVLAGGAFAAYQFLFKPRGPETPEALGAAEAAQAQVPGATPGAPGAPGEAARKATLAAGRKPIEYDPYRVYKVAISAWPGHMGGLVGNGGMTTQPGSIADKLGLRLEIKIIDEPVAKNTALQTGDVDFVWQVVDELPLNLPGYEAAGVEPRAFVQIDWSRGGDACVASAEVKTVEQIHGRKASVMQFCPDHTVLEFALQNSRLTPVQIAQVRADTSFSLDDWTFARTLFCQNKVDVACLWEPDVSLALACRKGAHRLFSTADATNLIADTLLTRVQLLEQAPEVAVKVARTFMDGADLAAKDTAAAARLVSTVVARFRDELGYDGTLKSFSWVRWTNLADNVKFFGADGGPVQFDQVYTQADTVWSQYPEAKLDRRYAPGKIRDDRVIRKLWSEAKALGRAPEPEQVRYDPAVAATGQAALAKPVSVHFAVNSADLDVESRFLLKSQVLPQLGMATGMSIRVEGNTDSDGDRGYNLRLSERRAKAVRDYLVEQGAYDPARVAAKGNGPDSPVASNATADGKAQNRRTDILFVRTTSL